MTNGPTTNPQEEAEIFADQAERAGLALPRPKRARPSDVAAIVATILLVTVGIGLATGWMDYRATPTTPPGVFGPQACSAQHGSVAAVIGSVGAGADPLLNASLAQLTQRFSSSYGSCVTVGFPTSASSPGIASLNARSADFAVVALAPTAAQLADAPSPEVVVPFSLSSVEVIYNLPASPDVLELNGSLLAGIYSGSITSWQAPEIRDLNPALSLGIADPISVVERSDANPLSLALSEYLSRASPTWNSSVGTAAQVAWPSGNSVTNESAMVAAVASTAGSIGFVATGTALPPNVAVASLVNPAGSPVLPSPASVSAAAQALENGTVSAGTNWSGLSLVDAPGAGSYPLAMYTYLVVFGDLGRAFAGGLSLSSAQWEMTYLWWTVTDGGYVTGSLGYVVLPTGVLSPSQLALERVAWDGSSLLESSEGSESGGETGEF
jgi:phosphate transport system substrate-binding protein